MTRWLGCFLATVLCIGNVLPAAAPQQPGSATVEGQLPDELARLRAMLAQPGADGREARETAVQRLVSMPKTEAHGILQTTLLRADDPDEVRGTILSALQLHLTSSQGQLFGGADAPAQLTILSGYVGALAPLWRGLEARTEETANPVRTAARLVLQRMPGRELETALRERLAAASPDDAVPLLRCAADLQHVHYARVIAEYVESPDSTVRAAARQSLQLLTFHEEEFTTRAQFQAWFDQFGSMRYADLAERAARRLPLRLERLRQELNRRIVDSAVEVVRAHTTRTPGLAWQAIGERMLVDDPAVLDACLEQLQKALADRLPTDEDPAARQAFARALLDRWRIVAPDQVRRRALLLEVAAYCVKAEDAELAPELVGLLSAQLEQQAPEVRLAALRGLRRFPSVDVRSRLVKHAAALAVAPAVAKSELDVILTTLSSRTAPRWYAPSAGDADRTDWLQFVRTICGLTGQSELRSKGLDLALFLDADGKRLPETFPLLLDLVGDVAQGPQFRAACLIHLRSWLDQESVADRLVTRLLELLADPEVEVRQKAAESLALRLPDLTDRRRPDWISSTIGAVRDRLAVESSAAVLSALVNVMQVCGRQPQMAEKAIGALNIVLQGLPMPLPVEQQFRLDPILLALSTVATDASASHGPWLGACDQLLVHGQRRPLRLILQSHGAIELAKEIGNPATRERALKAMRVVIATALLKPAKESFSSTEELQKEARDVRTAFSALDTLDENLRLDQPEHRILRLEVDLADRKYKEAAERAQAWLAANNGRAPMTPAQLLTVRMLAAEAQLGLAKPELAAALLQGRDAEVAPTPALLDLQVRIARQLASTNPKGAVDLLEKTLRNTPQADPAFRGRALEWANAQIRLDPASKAATVEVMERYVAVFEAADCSPEHREAFNQLRAQR